MNITLTAADGHELDCWLEPAKGPARGGLVILQEIFGVTDQLKGVARAYAAQGYEVAVPALFDRQRRRAVIPFADGSEGREMMQASKLEQTIMDADAAVGALAAKGLKVAVMGFCWGGGLTIRAAQELDVACGVAFYGTRLPQYMDKPLKAPVLGHFGTRDDHVPAEMLADAQAAWPELKVYKYEAGHAFANDQRPDFYSAQDAQLAHERSAEFLARHLG